MSYASKIKAPSGASSTAWMPTPHCAAIRRALARLAPPLGSENLPHRPRPHRLRPQHARPIRHARHASRRRSARRRRHARPRIPPRDPEQLRSPWGGRHRASPTHHLGPAACSFAQLDSKFLSPFRQRRSHDYSRSIRLANGSPTILGPRSSA